MQQRGQPLEFGGAVQHAVEPPEFLPEALGQFRVVVRGGAFWGGYGLAQQALATLVGMLDAELGAASPVRVCGLQPGPMRTTLRGRAYMADQDHDARDPSLWAAACVELLSPAGAALRGRVWKPAA